DEGGRRIGVVQNHHAPPRIGNGRLPPVLVDLLIPHVRITHHAPHGGIVAPFIHQRSLGRENGPQSKPAHSTLSSSTSNLPADHIQRTVLGLQKHFFQVQADHSDGRQNRSE